MFPDPFPFRYGSEVEHMGCVGGAAGILRRAQRDIQACVAGKTTRRVRIPARLGGAEGQGFAVEARSAETFEHALACETTLKSVRTPVFKTDSWLSL